MANDLGSMDFLAIAFMLILSWSIGIYYGYRDSKSVSADKTKLARYVLGNNKMAVLPVAFSISVTTVSGSLMVGVVGEVYLYGAQYMFFALGGFLGLVVSGLVVIPVYRKIKYVSIYEYLERRYDRTMRLFFSIVYILAKMIFSSVALYVPAICISTLTEVPQWVSIAVAGLVCVCYCVSGGIKAVIWTDVIQAFFMILSNCLIIVLGTARVGGLQNVWKANVEGDRIWHVTLVEDAHTRYSIWSLLFGAFIVFMNAMSAGQAAGQRILSVRGLRQAQSATFLGGFFIFSLIAVIIWTGIVIYANVSPCDPLLRSEITRVKSPDQILIYGMAQILEQPGLKGLALAGIFSGSLSTFSSYINSFATLTIEDFIRPTLKKHGKILTDNKSLVLCKCLTCIFGFICIILAFLVPFMGGVIKAGIQITGATGGPLLAVIFLGVFSRTANKRGVLLGLICGLSLNLWLSVGSTLHKTRFTTLPLTDRGCLTLVNMTDSPLSELTSNATSPLYSNASSTLHSNVSTALPSFGIIQFNDTEVELTEKSQTAKEPSRFFSISFMWQGPIGFLITLLLGYIVSRIISFKTTKPNEIDPRLLSDWVKTQAEKIVIGSFERVSTCTPLYDVSSSSKSEDEKLQAEECDVDSSDHYLEKMNDACLRRNS